MSSRRENSASSSSLTSLFMSFEAEESVQIKGWYKTSNPGSEVETGIKEKKDVSPKKFKERNKREKSCERSGDESKE